MRKILPTVLLLGIVCSFFFFHTCAIGESPAVHEPWKKYGITLTPEEEAWLRTNPIIKLGLDPQWPPFSFNNANGKTQGIDIDFIQEVERRLGIRFLRVEARVWEETNNRIFSGELDVVTGITPTDPRREKLLFTDPYISFPTGIISRSDGPFLTTLGALRNVTFASPKRYVTTERLKADFKDLPIKETDTLLQALELVSQGEADIVVGNLVPVSYLIRQHGLTNLKIAGIGDYRFDLSFGVRKNLPELHSAIGKALASMTAQERSAILQRWVPLDSDPAIRQSRNFRWILAILSIGLLGYIGFWFWNRRLARELAERRIIENQLRLLDEEKSHFMNMAAHDVNNPLSAIILQCEVVGLQEEQPPAVYRKQFSDILDNATRISRLIRNLLNVNAIEQGSLHIQIQPVDLNAAAQQIIAQYEGIASRKNISLQLTSQESSCHIAADPDSLLQVLENLVSNALKFTPLGGNVSIAISRHDGLGRIVVRDSGPGISPADQARLFGKFARLTAQPTANESSHGLGLSIVKKLVTQMQGTVWAESGEGTGAAFFVDLPLAHSPG